MQTKLPTSRFFELASSTWVGIFPRNTSRCSVPQSARIDHRKCRAAWTGDALADPEVFEKVAAIALVLSPLSARTCREDHAPSHRPQMSSGRLFLDRVARQQGPSPLHRHPQINTHSQGVQAKGDISTLPGRRHFYFALTIRSPPLDDVNNLRHHCKCQR